MRVSEAERDRDRERLSECVGTQYCSDVFDVLGNPYDKKAEKIKSKRYVCASFHAMSVCVCVCESV